MAEVQRSPPSASAACEETRARLYCGTDEPVPEPRLLIAGPLSCEFVQGNLRNIRFGGCEVLRAISFVVRDEDWGTYAPVLCDLQIEETPQDFSVRYNATCEGRDGERLVFRARISGHSEGKLAFDADAVPETDFRTNRCGFTVLHPVVGLAGSKVTVEHVDGAVEHSRLPDLIDPYQPFKHMRAITHEVMPGVSATCCMEGDAFEMEDQRNWSDASYKTYVRPLALPWPYVLPAKIPVHQSVRLTVRGERPLPAAKSDGGRAIRIELGEEAGQVPHFGLVVTPEEADAVLEASDRLAALGPQTLLFHFDPTAGHDAAALAAFAGIASAHPGETALECVVPCLRVLDEELGDVARMVAQAGLRLDAVAVSPSVDRKSTPPGSVWPDCPPLEDVYDAARRAFPQTRLGGGMFSYFTELNRKRPPVDLLDFVTHCTCPIVHDADDRSVMQSLEALPFILRSARAIIGKDKAYRIGPSTIGMRQNPYGGRTMPNPARTRMTMTPDDPRQSGLFAAAWMIGYASRLIEARVENFVGGALTGSFGLLGDDGKRRPVFHAARFLTGLGGGRALSCTSDAEDRILALAAQRERGGRVLLLANLTDAIQSVVLPFGSRVAVLDETSVADAARSDTLAFVPVVSGRLALKPYAVACVEE